ncbi:MAG: TonB family protein [Acidobacteriia bacterium]|nr:TonB family protein [Terriglobia bacterium]
MPPTQNESAIAQDAPAAAPLQPAARPNARNPEAPKPQPVCLEMPVSVHGACNVEGSDKREKFHEATRTVLIFAGGAVLRLAASVSPGQLLFLTNERSKREIVCQVVKSKSYRNVSGYVELEFCEPCPGFWGVSFPGERSAAGTASAPGTAALPAAVNAESFAAPPLPKVVLPPPAAGPAESYLSAPPPIAASVPAAETPLAPAEPLPLPAFQNVDRSAVTQNVDRSAVTQNVDRSAVTQNVDRSAVTQNKEDAPEQTAPESLAIPAVREENLAPGEPPAVLETGPASLTFLSPVAPVSALAAQEPEAQAAPEPATLPEASAWPAGPAQDKPQERPAHSLLSKNEEVAVPNWLSPAALAPPSEPRAEAMPAAKSETNALAFTASRSHDSKILPLPERRTEPELATNVAEPIGYLQLGDKPFVPGPRAVRETPAFGSGILLAGEKSAPAARPGAGRGLLYLATAAAILVSLAGAKWYLRQAAQPHQDAAVAEAAPAAVSSAVAKTVPQPEATPSAVAGNPVSTSVSLAASPADSLPPIPIVMDSPAAPAKRDAPVVGVAGKASKAPAALQFVDPEKPPKKLPPGIRLAAPVVAPRAARPGAAAEDANLGTLPGAPVAADAAAGLPAVHSKPAAPRSSGVQPARLLSSVPPVYPSLARSENIAGDVVLDALIDANGQVTAMKILSGHPLLQQAARDALRQWRYQPALLDGKPAAAHLTVTIQFRLQR